MRLRLRVTWRDGVPYMITSAAINLQNDNLVVDAVNGSDGSEVRFEMSDREFNALPAEWFEYAGHAPPLPPHPSTWQYYGGTWTAQCSHGVDREHPCAQCEQAFFQQQAKGDDVK